MQVNIYVNGKENKVIVFGNLGFSTLAMLTPDYLTYQIYYARDLALEVLMKRKGGIS